MHLKLNTTIELFFKILDYEISFQDYKFLICFYSLSQISYPVNVYYVLLWVLGPTAFFTCIAHLYLYYTLLVPHTYASYIRH